MMNHRLFTFSAALLVLSVAMAGAERLYVNDKKAPDSIRDLQALQTRLLEVMPEARAATVCIDLGEGSGSGVIVSPDGLVLTAAHVSTGVNKKLTVVLEDGTKYDAISLGLVAATDAAMVQITEKDKGPFPFVEIDRKNTARLGDWVFSLGHSGGFDKERGVVSRLGRLVRIANNTLQSDCMLIGGDSGGPLFDLNGKLVGIHSRVGQQLEVNMHVPMSEFTSNWEEMLKSEFIGEGPFAQKPRKGSGYLGLATENREEGGLRVTKVGGDSPALEAGVEENDILLSMNGEPLEKREQLQDILKEMAAGEIVEIEILSGKETKTLKITLGER